jgi:hypothetical protein
MPTDLIRYDLLVQDALKSVVRKVLADAARDGLPGGHHFFITFRTRAPGVRLSNQMREEYPQEMTIILQHQFWDLTVTEHNFEVGLSFRNVQERVVVPFDALIGFFDPSVQFGLKFEVEDVAPATSANDAAPPAALPGPAKEAQKAPRSTNAAGNGKQPVPPRASPVKPAGDAGSAAKNAEKVAEAPTQPETKVISIDAFRKKT